MARKLNSEEAHEFTATVQRERTGAAGQSHLATRLLAEWPESERPTARAFEWPDHLSFKLPDS